MTIASKSHCDNMAFIHLTSPRGYFTTLDDDEIPATQPYPPAGELALARPAVLLPAPPPRERRETPEERARRQWSMAMTDFLRHVHKCRWITVKSVLTHFKISEEQLDLIINGNSRMETEVREDGSRWIRGVRSDGSARR